ncbi:MAG TPA: TonB-dependent receptor plug domain-containing protein, partial [Flavitalea sp.]|nr:TonB-dependent receptor plug domain-containing protein [Flavitalea sp.]
MRIRRRTYLMVLSMLLCGTMLNAQTTKNLSGTIRDASGAPAAGVTVQLKGKNVFATTDERGVYTIAASDTDTLVVTGVGFAVRELPASAASSEIVLQTSQNTLSEVVVTALGVSKQKRSLGYSVTNVKGTELAKTNEINPINALQGRVAGVQIDQGAGGLFGNTKIVIRGNSTLGKNNQPIFVIDGVIMDNDVFNGTGRDFGNDLKNLNMDDFESVSVLRGSSAAALYGSRAINGV